MCARQRQSERLEHELRDRIAGGGKLRHEDVPFRCVALGSPVAVDVGVGRVEDGILERDHLPMPICVSKDATQVFK